MKTQVHIHKAAALQPLLRLAVAQSQYVPINAHAPWQPRSVDREQWQPIQHSQLRQHGEFRHVSVSERSAITAVWSESSCAFPKNGTARGSHLHTARRSVCDRDQDGIKRSRPLLETIKRSRSFFGGDQRSRCPQSDSASTLQVVLPPEVDGALEQWRLTARQKRSYLHHQGEFQHIIISSSEPPRTPPPYGPV